MAKQLSISHVSDSFSACVRMHAWQVQSRQGSRSWGSADELQLSTAAAEQVPLSVRERIITSNERATPGDKYGEMPLDTTARPRQILDENRRFEK